jgi:hypothetical protein
MARMTNGLLGPVSGKIGPVVTSSRNGTPYVKSRPVRRAPATEKEIANREKWKRTQAWVKPIREFVKAGFKNYSPKVQGYGAAVSYLRRHAFDSNEANSPINPAKMLVSFGDLPLPAGLFVWPEDQQLHFSWNPDITDDVNPDDQAMLLAYDVSDAASVCFTTTGQFRKTGHDMLPVFPCKTYQVYIAFSAADRSRQSDSVYLGEIKT